MLNEMADEELQVLNFSSAVYGLNAIRKAACVFDGRFYVLVERRDQMTEVRLIPKKRFKALGDFVIQFCNEVLDQELRERVTAEMSGVRSLLLEAAFSKISLANCMPIVGMRMPTTIH